MKSEFKKYLQSFAGCEGGNLNSEIWFFGLEWGLDAQDDELDLTPIYEMDSWKEKDNISPKEYNDYPLGKFNQKVIWFLSYFYNFDLGQGTKDYRNLAKEYEICYPKGKGFRANFYPIGFKNRQSTLWTDNLKLSTGLNSFEEYRQACVGYRGEFFRQKIDEYNPKYIICTGLNDVAYFIEGLTGQKQYFTEFTQDKQKIHYAKYKNTLVFVVPFFGRPVNSYEKMKNLVEKIKTIK